MAVSTEKYFNEYFKTPINFTPNEVDSVIAYFLKRGFGEVAAINTSVVLLQQAKQDRINVYKLIDTLKGINDIQLSNIVTQILNDNRNKTSTLGFRVQDRGTLLERRNVILPTTPEEEIIQDPPISDYIQPGYVQRGYVE